MDDDSALVARLKAGDKASLNDLVRQWSPWMLNAATKRLRNRSLADDVVQDTWINVVKGIGGFKGQSSLRTWVNTILFNQVRDAVRKEQRCRMVPVEAISDYRPATDPLCQPEHVLSWHATVAMVQHEIAQLPCPDQRKVITMLLDEYSPTEAARALAIPVGTAKSRGYRARLQLCERLAEQLSA